MCTGLQVLKLHENWEHLNDCVAVLNAEWSMRIDFRVQRMRMSCEKLPTSFLLLYADHTGKSQVVGYARVIRIVSLMDCSFVESVTILKEHRGKGWGKFLMTGIEKFLTKKKIKSIFLCTVDAEEFYIKLGYKICDPPAIYNNFSSNHVESAIQKLSNFSKLEIEDENAAVLPSKLINDLQNPVNSEERLKDNIKNIVPPKPPPLPDLVKDLVQPPPKQRKSKIFLVKILKINPYDETETKKFPNDI